MNTCKMRNNITLYIHIGEDKFEKVLAYHQHSAGIGSIKQTEVPPKQTHDYCKLVSDKVHDLEEE